MNNQRLFPVPVFRAIQESGLLPRSRTPLSAVRNKPVSTIYLALAAAFVVASFLDGVNLLAVPVAENPANVVGLLLSGLFVLTRLSHARLWTGPVRYFWVFIGLTAVLELGRWGVSMQSDDTRSLRIYAMYVQVFLLYLIIFDLCRSFRAVRVLAAAFVISAILMSLVANLRVGGLVGAATVGRLTEAERVGVLGMNFNLQGFIYSVAIIGIVCRSVDRWPRLDLQGWLLVGGAASMILALLRTGSRGALLTLVVGLTVALVLMFRGRRGAAYVLLVPLALYGIGSAIMSTDVIRVRMEQALFEGRLGSRDKLASEASVMILERPITGWGCTYTADLGARVGRDRIAAHNTYLQLATTFGLTGFLPWIMGIGATVRRLWKYRTHFWGATMLAVMATFLIGALPSNMAYSRFAWMILAVAGAMPFHAPLPFKGTKTLGPSSRSPTPGRSPLRSRLRQQQRP